MARRMGRQPVEQGERRGRAVGSALSQSPVQTWDVVLCLLLILYFVGWHSAGVFGGGVFFSEDTAAYFYSNRAVHHLIASSGDWSFWDPLPGLGQPRLANIQNGSFAPLSLLFYFFPTASAFAIYPALALSLLSLFTFGLFRARGLSPLAAAFGALSWTTLGSLTNHLQHPPVIETLIWLPVTLLGWELAQRTRCGAWAVLGGVALAFQCFGSSPQYLVYNGLVMTLWIGVDLFSARVDRRELMQRGAWATGIVVVGVGLASWQLLPFLEMVRESHRSLLNDLDTYRELYRAAPLEVLLALAAETFWFIDAPRLAHGSPYSNLPNLSLLTLVLVGAAFLRRPRPWALGVGAALFLLGMLGAAGGVTTILSEIVPFADRLRAPIRMIVPAAFLLSWLAALGLQRLLDANWRSQHWIAIAALGWVALVGWTLKRPLDRYVDPVRFRVPPAIAQATGRVVTDFRHSQSGIPLFYINAGLAAEVPTLLMREVLIPRNFFEAYFASQFGSLDQTKAVDRMIMSAALPVVRPGAPMMRAFRLETLVRYHDGRVAARRLPGTLDRFTLVPAGVVAADSESLWALAGSPKWDPRERVLLRSPVPGLPEQAAASGEAEIRVLLDDKAEQILEVESSGGILVTSELFFPGWSVEVDGQEAEALEVDLALRGVALSAGRHEVHWTYRPTWLPFAWIGLGISLAASFALVVIPARLASSKES